MHTGILQWEARVHWCSNSTCVLCFDTYLANRKCMSVNDTVWRSVLTRIHVGMLKSDINMYLLLPLLLLLLSLSLTLKAHDQISSMWKELESLRKQVEGGSTHEAEPIPLAQINEHHGGMENGRMGSTSSNNSIINESFLELQCTLCKEKIK